MVRPIAQDLHVSDMRHTGNLSHGILQHARTRTGFAHDARERGERALIIPGFLWIGQRATQSTNEQPRPADSVGEIKGNLRRANVRSAVEVPSGAGLLLRALDLGAAAAY